MAWNTTSAVINFIMLEGARSSSAFFSNSTLPLVASIRIAVGASPSKASSSVFLAPWTLWLAACVIPPQPMAATRHAAVRPRNQRLEKSLDLLRDESVAAIGDRPLDGARSNRWNRREQLSFSATCRGAADSETAPISRIVQQSRPISLSSRYGHHRCVRQSRAAGRAAERRHWSQAPE